MREILRDFLVTGSRWRVLGAPKGEVSKVSFIDQLWLFWLGKGYLVGNLLRFLFVGLSTFVLSLARFSISHIFSIVVSIET